MKFGNNQAAIVYLLYENNIYMKFCVTPYGITDMNSLTT